MKQKGERDPIVHLEMLQNQEKDSLSQEVIKTKNLTTLKKELDTHIHTRKSKIIRITPFWKDTLNPIFQN